MDNKDVTPEMERARDLMDGKAKAPNEFVAYHVEKAVEVRAEHEAVTQAIVNGDRQLNALKQKALMLRAQLESHLETISRWDDGSGSRPAEL